MYWVQRGVGAVMLPHDLHNAQLGVCFMEWNSTWFVYYEDVFVVCNNAGSWHEA